MGYGERTPAGFIADKLFDSIRAGIAQEIQASREATTTRPLEIDGIQHLQNIGGRFVYRLMLSSTFSFSADQPLQFRARNSKESIPATVVSIDDDGLVIESEKPLPTDAKLVSVKFDPSFIYQALDEYLSHASYGTITKDFLDRRLVPIRKSRHSERYGLNDDQSAAVDEMSTVPIHLLWGPPGTGKTTTLGAAVAEWLQRGKSVLIVSTSNVAVDVAMRSLLKRVKPRQRSHILRLGTSLDPEVNDITLAGKLRRADYKAAFDATFAQGRLNEINELLSNRTNSYQRFQELWSEYSRLENLISQANEKAAHLLPSLLPDIRVIGCTLAKMVLDNSVRERHFDIVVIDEVSMVSVVYALAASTLAKSHFILAGDPLQLPPICQSSGLDAQKWFGKNCYDWFGLGCWDDGFDSSRFSVLRTQYRMTIEIGGVVSRLSYGNFLRHGRATHGTQVEFVDLPIEWQTTYYSVQDESYFHFASIPLIHALAEVLPAERDLLLLSPFRPQRSLLAALAFDLQERFSKRRVTASTIHRSQGSESKAVILDLTTHRVDKLVAFFRDKHCANLFNVGLSRARDDLIILGNRQMLRVLAREQPFWQKVLVELEGSVNVLPGIDILEEISSENDLERLMMTSNVDAPALYCHSNSLASPYPLINLLRKAKSSRRLLVLPIHDHRVDDSELVVRHSTGTPPVFMANGIVAVPLSGGWLPSYSPNVARVLWRIGFSHLADEEIDPMRARRFFCPECANGELVLRRVGGEGWYLVCSNGSSFECPFRRRLSLEDAVLKVQIAGMKCPSGHPLTARQGGKGIFIGCENYPKCQYSARLSLLEGT